MKKYVLLLLALLVSGSASAAMPLLEYRCSNSLYQSKVVFFEDGVIATDESCSELCSNHTYTQKDRLSDEDLFYLTEGIQSLDENFQYSENSIGEPCLGEISVFRDGKKIVIRSVVQPLSHGPITSMWKTSEGARNLEELAIKYAKQKMALKTR